MTGGIGIALGAGGRRGFAHVGVLETLVEHGIPIAYIAGASIGSVIGTLWAFGHPPDQIMEMVADTRRHLLALTVPVRSLLSNRGIRRHIERSAAGRAFEDSPIPLAAVATDLRDGSRVALRAGHLAPAILASSSIPGLFPPVTLGGRTLVDGGLSEPVPTTTVAELGARVVIGVSLASARGDAPAPRGLLGTLLRSSEILQARADAHAARRADLVIAPDLPALGSAASYRAAGRAATLAALPRLRQLAGLPS
jgi:NTE family protein|nr:patatin-like phospholipase family protein [Kofleriaceae bacterium]